MGQLHCCSLIVCVPILLVVSEVQFSFYFSDKTFTYEFGDDNNTMQGFVLDHNVIAILKEFQKLHIRSLRIDETGVFYIVSDALESNVPGVESGVFIPFSNE